MHVEIKGQTIWEGDIQGKTNADGIGVKREFNQNAF